jgi:hypothetical protein
MDFITHSYKHADAIFAQHKYKEQWAEINDAIKAISDEDLKKGYSVSTNTKSLSNALNRLLSKELTSRGWKPEAQIFHGPIHGSSKKESVWRLDFAKKDISIEVSFNHGEAIAWNLIKPTIASEFNHVDKAIQTQLAVVIFATEAFKKVGGFDSAVGSFEKAITYLEPLNFLLNVPIMLIGLLPPKTFKMNVVKEGIKKRGHITELK